MDEINMIIFYKCIIHIQVESWIPSYSLFPVIPFIFHSTQHNTISWLIWKCPESRGDLSGQLADLTILWLNKKMLLLRSINILRSTVFDGYSRQIRKRWSNTKSIILNEALCKEKEVKLSLSQTQIEYYIFHLSQTFFKIYELWWQESITIWS